MENVMEKLVYANVIDISVVKSVNSKNVSEDVEMENVTTLLVFVNVLMDLLV